jgi:hypothetical protein
MRRVLELRIIGLNSHRVTGSAKVVGRGVAVDRDAGDDVFALAETAAFGRAKDSIP